MNSNSRYGDILSAASNVVKTLGAEKLTLDAVAKEAGVSKGGLLHHFPNKQALIHAMAKESSRQFVADLNAKVENSPSDGGRWTRAYLEATCEDAANEHSKELSTALIASLYSNPDILAKLRTSYSGWQKNIENDGIDPVAATIVRLAVDGLWLAEIFGLGNLDPELRNQVIDALKKMTET
jgi:Transcriptional regulator